MIQATGTVNSASVVVSMSTLSVDSYSIATQTLQSNVFASSIQPTATLIAQDPFITSLPTATPTQSKKKHVLLDKFFFFFIQIRVLVHLVKMCGE